MFFVLTELKSRLQELYKKEFKYVPFAAGARTDNRCSFHELYALPKLFKKSFINEEIDWCFPQTLTTYEDIFYHRLNKKRIRKYDNVYIVGEAGSGKSSFFQNIALCWSEDPHLLPDEDDSEERIFEDEDVIREFDFVFYFGLGDSRNRCSYVEMIRDQLLHKMYRSEEIEDASNLVKMVLANCKCLIAADDLHEWSHPEGQCKCPSERRGFAPLIHHKNKATVFLSGTGKISIFYDRRDNYIELRGTDDEQRFGENVVKVLNGNTGTKCYTEFEECVKEKEIEYFVLSTPILLIQVIVLWFYEQNLPRSMTKLYAKLLDMFIGQTQAYCNTTIYSRQRCSNENEDAFKCSFLLTERNIIANWKYIDVLSKLAFDKLLLKDGQLSVVFNRDEWDIDEATLRFALEIGILKEKKSSLGRGQPFYFSFQHTSFIEFFAAIHLSEHPQVLASVIEPRFKNGSVAHMRKALSRVFLFVCALNKDIADSMSKLISGYSTDEAFDEGSMMNILFNGLREADNAGVTEIHLTCPQKMVVFDNARHRHKPYMRLISMNVSHITYMEINDCLLLYHCISNIIGNLSQLQEVKLDGMNLRDLPHSLSDCNTDIELDKALVSSGILLHDTPQLHKVTLRNMDLGDHPLMLPQCITEISLESVTMNKGVLLHDLPQLQQVNLQQMRLRDLPLKLPQSLMEITMWMVTMSRGVILHDLLQLQKVTLGSMHLGDLPLKLPQSVTEINLMSVQISSGVLLQDLSKLQKVKLKDMDLSEVPVLLPQCVNEVTLKNVSLENTEFPYDLPHLRKLKLCHMHFDQLPFLLPQCVKDVTLSSVSWCSGFKLNDISELEKITLSLMTFIEIPLPLPRSVTDISLSYVTMSNDNVNSLLDHLEFVPHPVQCFVSDCMLRLRDDQEDRLKMRVQSSERLLFENVEINDLPQISFKCQTVQRTDPQNPL